MMNDWVALSALLDAAGPSLCPDATCDVIIHRPEYIRGSSGCGAAPPSMIHKQQRSGQRCDKPTISSWDSAGSSLESQLKAFLSSFMITARAGEQTLGGMTLVGGEILGVLEEEEASCKKHDDLPRDSRLRDCISEPHPSRAARASSEGSAAPAAAGSVAGAGAGGGGAAWLGGRTIAEASALGGMTLVGGELFGVPDDSPAVHAVGAAMVRRSSKGSKAD